MHRVFTIYPFERLHLANFTDFKGQRKLSSLIRKTDKPNRWNFDSQDTYSGETLSGESDELFAK